MAVTWAAMSLAAPCDPDPIQPRVEDRDALMAYAKIAVRDHKNAEARALYAFIIKAYPNDQEAWLRLSLLNAWDGCFGRAESGFRLLLSRNFRDSEARSGLVDVLMWQTRWAEARENLRAGLEIDPTSAALHLRKSKFLFWSGDATQALDELKLARQYGAPAEDVRPLQRRLYLTQLNSMTRLDMFPAGYPNIYTWSMNALRRSGRVELTLGTTFYRHSGAESDMIVDGRHSLGVLYNLGINARVGLSGGVGAPAHWAPTFEAKAWTVFPLLHRFSGFFAYGLMQYGTHKSVHIFAPALGYTVGDNLHLELRWWTSYVAVHSPATSMDSIRTGFAHSIGFIGRARVVPDLAVGASYSYGTQLDENPIIVRLFPLTSHVAALFSDWTLADHYGVLPLFGIERRRSAVTSVSIFSAEMGVYWRW